MFDKKEKTGEQKGQVSTPPPMNLQQTQEKLNEAEAQCAHLQGQLIKISSAYNNLHADMILYRKQVAQLSLFIAKLLTTTDDPKEKA